MSTHASTATPKTAWSGRDNLDREDYAILEKIITAGRIMNAWGIDYKETQSYVEQGKIDIERYREKIPRGQTVEERDAILRKALVTAYEVNPYGLVEAVAGGPISKPGQVVTQMAQEYGNGDASFRSEIVGMIAMTLKDRYALDRMTPQFVNRVDAQGRSIAKVRADELKGRAASTDMITNWNPSAGGVVMYLRKMINTTCRPLVIENLNSRLDTISLDAISDMGFEPVDKGNGERGFARTRTSVEYEGGERIEEEEHEVQGLDAVERERRAAERDLKRHQTAHDLERTGDIEAEEQAEAIKAGQIDIDDDEDQIPPGDIDEEEHPGKTGKSKPFEPSDPNRSDMRLIADCLEATGQREAADELRAAAAEEARFRLMKASVLTLVNLAVNMEDRETVLEVAAEWDPSRDSLDKHLPEFREHAESANNRFEAEKPRAGEILQNIIQLDMFSAPDSAASPQEHLEHAEMVAEFSKLWRTHPTPADLQSTERRDFKFLVHVTGAEVSCPSDAGKRDALMRQMGAAAIRSAIGKTTATTALDTIEKELLSGVEDWNPSRIFFSEMVCAKLVEMNNRSMLSPETVAGAVLSVSADDAAEQAEERRAKEAKAAGKKPGKDDDRLPSHLAQEALEDRKAKTFARRAQVMDGGSRAGDMELFGNAVELEAEQNTTPAIDSPAA